MTFLKRIHILFAVLFIFACDVKAQDSAIGHWQSIFPYNRSLGVASDGNHLFGISQLSFFVYNNATGQMNTYSKVEGMSDIGMKCVGYDIATGTVILVYADGNIDLFKDNTFYNIPDLLLKTVTGDKVVYEVYTDNGMAYISTSLGVLKVDLADHSVKELYQFFDLSGSSSQLSAVKSFVRIGSDFYAATTKGLYRADKNSPQLENFLAWQVLDTGRQFNALVQFNNSLFLATDTAVYTLAGDTVRMVYTSPSNVKHIDAGDSGLFISEARRGAVRIMDAAYNIVDTFKVPGIPLQVIQIANKSIWYADSVSGVFQRFKGDQVGRFAPNGPSDVYAFDIYANNTDLYIAHGGYSANFYKDGNFAGVTYLNGAAKYKFYKQYDYNPFDSLSDFVAVAKDESNGIVYFGSYIDGVFMLKPDGSYRLFKQDVFDQSKAYGGTDARQVMSLAIDKNHNLWATEYSSVQSQLYVKTPDDVWHKYFVPGAGDVGQLLIDDYNQAWFISISNGLVVYSASAFTGASNDAYYHLTTGIGSGNLPSNNVYCIAKDKNNQVWAGTDNGIGIISNCSAPFSQNPPCDAQIPIVQYDKYAGYLFASNNVRAIAVDGANRKWVGTDDGVWLLSPGAEKIIYRFTKDNSPLPSNHIQKIAIDGVTGDVYFGTDEGIVSYHSTATEGGISNGNVHVFPNPVPSGFGGAIAIKGLAANADVRITDIDGQLVYRTKALGGQAVWNGKDYTGRRPQSGVYLFFVSSSDGQQTYTGKIVFMQ